MRRTSTRMGTFALIVVTMLMTVGLGTSSAQHEHEHPTTTTTRPTTTTTRPGGTTTTTRPGGTTTTTRPSPTTTFPTNPGARTTQVSYGPFTIPAAPDNPDGTHGHSHTGNQFSFMVQKPCSDCFITGMKADLRYADGRQAGYSTNAMLHHMVLFNRAWGRTDATCDVGFPFPLGLLFGQRFFASGDERTEVVFPQGYGYRVGAWDMWNLIWELAGMEDVAQRVNINMTFQWVPASTPGMTDVEPVWFDANQCGDSHLQVPAGRSTKSWTWTVNRPGRLLGIGGHLHDGGINMTVRNDTTGQLICDSRAGYGESPLYVDHHGVGHLSSMSFCSGTGTNPVARLSNGQRVTITGHYDMPAAVTDQMAIAIAYVAPG
jgi:hypothetical protein